LELKLGKADMTDKKFDERIKEKQEHLEKCIDEAIRLCEKQLSMLKENEKTMEEFLNKKGGIS
jgi:hypothetical protein